MADRLPIVKHFAVKGGKLFYSKGKIGEGAVADFKQKALDAVPDADKDLYAFVVGQGEFRDLRLARYDSVEKAIAGARERLHKEEHESLTLGKIHGIARKRKIFKEIVEFSLEYVENERQVSELTTAALSKELQQVSLRFPGVYLLGDPSEGKLYCQQPASMAKALEEAIIRICPSIADSVSVEAGANQPYGAITKLADLTLTFRPEVFVEKSSDCAETEDFEATSTTLFWGESESGFSGFITLADKIWKLELAREIASAKAVEFSANGSRVIKAFSEKIGAEEVEAMPDSCVEVDHLLVEPGIQSENMREFFVKGSLLRGRLMIEKTATGTHTLTLDRGAPLVLDPALASIAPVQKSYLPSSLEALIPAECRWWSCENSREVHKKFVDSGFFTADNLALIDGEYSRITTKLYKADNELPVLGSIDILEDLDSIVSDRDKDIAVFDYRGQDSVPYAQIFGDIGECQDYLVLKDDSVKARKELSRLGRPFYLGRHRGTLVVTSSNVKKASDLQFVEHTSTTFRSFAESANEKCALNSALNSDIRIAKADNSEERYILGIVLEPDVPDAHNDIYSADEVRKAAFIFMEEFGDIGLQHGEIITGKAKILESYITPVDFDIDGEKVRAGTWLMGVRVIDDNLWESVKKGEITGFSIGGSAIRTPAA